MFIGPSPSSNVTSFRSLRAAGLRNVNPCDAAQMKGQLCHTFRCFQRGHGPPAGAVGLAPASSGAGTWADIGAEETMPPEGRVPSVRPKLIGSPSLSLGRGVRARHLFRTALSWTHGYLASLK